MLVFHNDIGVTHTMATFEIKYTISFSMEDGDCIERKGSIYREGDNKEEVEEEFLEIYQNMCEDKLVDMPNTDSSISESCLYIDKIIKKRKSV